MSAPDDPLTVAAEGGASVNSGMKKVTSGSSESFA
jgi:hypothetical protein